MIVTPCDHARMSPCVKRKSLNPCVANFEAASRRLEEHVEPICWQCRRCRTGPRGLGARSIAAGAAGALPRNCRPQPDIHGARQPTAARCGASRVRRTELRVRACPTWRFAGWRAAPFRPPAQRRQEALAAGLVVARRAGAGFRGRRADHRCRSRRCRRSAAPDVRQSQHGPGGNHRPLRRGMDRLGDRRRGRSVVRRAGRAMSGGGRHDRARARRGSVDWRGRGKRRQAVSAQGARRAIDAGTARRREPKP